MGDAPLYKDSRVSHLVQHNNVRHRENCGLFYIYIPYSLTMHIFETGAVRLDHFHFHLNSITRVLWLTGSCQLKAYFGRRRMICSIWIEWNCFHTFPRCSICIRSIFGCGTSGVVFFIILFLIMHAVPEELTYGMWCSRYPKQLYEYMNASFLALVNNAKVTILYLWCMDFSNCHSLWFHEKLSYPLLWETTF